MSLMLAMKLIMLRIAQILGRSMSIAKVKVDVQTLLRVEDKVMEV